MFQKLKMTLFHFLHLIQRYTKTDMIYLAKGSFWMMSRQIVTSIIAFGMAIFFAKFLPKETYGFYKYILSIAALLAMTTMSGINTSLVRSVAKGYEGSIFPALYTKIKWGLIGAVFALGIVFYYGLQSNKMLASVFVIVAVFLPLKSSFSVYQSYWQGKQRFDIFAKFSLLQEILATIPMMITLFLTNSLFLIVLVYFCSQTIASACLYFITILQRNNDVKDQEMVSYGKHMSLSSVLFFIANNVTDIVIWHMLGPISVAIYAFATRPPNELRRIFTEAFPIALPKFSQQAKNEIQQSLLKKIGKLYILLVPITIAYIFVAPWIYHLFFPEYQESIFYSQLFSLTILFAPLSLLGTVFQGLGRKKEIYISSTLSPLFLIVALLIFTPLYGLTGVIIALFCELILQFIVSLFLFKRM